MLMIFKSLSLYLARCMSNLTSAVCEGVRQGLCRWPVHSWKCHIFPFLVPWVPIWMTGVDGQGIVSSCGITNEEYKISV